MKLSRAMRLRLGASALVGGALVACALDPLNPQPLPPQPDPGFLADGGNTPAPDASRTNDPVFQDAGVETPLDAAIPPTDDDAGPSDGGPSDAGAADADAG